MTSWLGSRFYQTKNESVKLNGCNVSKWEGKGGTRERVRKDERCREIFTTPQTYSLVWGSVCVVCDYVKQLVPTNQHLRTFITRIS